MLRERPERAMVLRIPELDAEGMRAEGMRAEGTAPERVSAEERARAAAERERRWAQAILAVEALMPGVEPLRSGWCALRARGPARYYGGEAAAAAVLVGCARELGFGEAAVGVASGVFAAEQAARAVEGDPGTEAAAPGVRIAAPEETERLLAPLPVSRAADDELAEVLVGLGIRTLGAFAALPEGAVGERFGAAGLAAHRRANGCPQRPALGWGGSRVPEVSPREPPPELAVRFAFEPPLDGSDQLAFASSAHAEALVRRLVSRGLVCTELRVELVDEAGSRHERLWAHPARFTAADVVNRLRWQAAALPDDPERGGAGIAEVLLEPVRTARAAEHEPGLWSTAPDERVHHHLSRVQSLLGHEEVGTGELLGGRTSAARQRLVPWGTPPTSSASDRSGPWPGHLVGAKPNLVFSPPAPARLLDRAGAEVALDPAGLLTAEPARLAVRLDGGTGSPSDPAIRPLPAPVLAWSAPWPLRERWWRQEAGAATSGVRLQLVLDDGDAWLLTHSAAHGWAAEARYA